MKSLARDKIFVLSFILFIIVISFSLFLRNNLSNGSLVDDESYFNLRIAREISENNGKISEFDKFSYSGRGNTYFFGLPYLIYFSSTLFSDDLVLAAKVISLITSFLIFILVYLILKKLTKGKKSSMYGLFILALSPALVYLTLSSTSNSIILFLSLLSFYFFLKDNRTCLILSSIVLAPIIFFGVYDLIFVMVLLLAYIILFKREKFIWFFLTATTLALLFWAYYQFYLSNYLFEHVRFTDFDTQFSLVNYVSDLGGSQGIGIFSLILSVFGISYLWNKTNRKFSIMLFTILFFALSVRYLWTISYFNILISILAGFGIIEIFKSKWESSLIRNLSIVLLIGGLVFSSISYIGRVGELEPNKDFTEAMNFLSNNGYDHNIVFSHYSRGHYISFSSKKNVMDSDFFYAPKVNKRWVDSRLLFYGQDSEKIRKIFNDYSIDYIWLDNDLRKNLYKGMDENRYLPFFLEHGNEYRLVFNNTNVDIWRYVVE